ncbi:MAG TPA: enoyl-CoA hydratase-related protein [Polyangiaceae bacterium]|jgi:enoyl-CoA hydratase|nr:enoyl-CoA hydratase-related protein [Polyangiaceae bacterium]
MYQTILVSEALPVITVTINRPSKLNALNAQVILELTQAFQALEAAPAAERVRAVILTGAGEKAFVAGADIAEMSGLSAAQAYGFSAQGHRLGRLMEDVSFPIIAAVNGFALGGGCELALCADYIFASERAKFGQPETNLGLMPGFGGTQRLARRVGLGHARELVYAGEPISAAQALAIGLVNRVVPPEELLPQAERHAQRIAEQAPLAVASSKRALNHGFDTDLAAGCELEATAFGALFATEDAREGLTAFLAKRRAAYKAS